MEAWATLCLSKVDAAKQIGELQATVAHLQDKLERADVRNALLLQELDEAQQELAIAHDEAKGLSTALQWRRATTHVSTSPTPPVAASRSTEGGGLMRTTLRRRRRRGSADPDADRSSAAASPSPPMDADHQPPLDAFRTCLVEVLALRERGGYDAELLRRFGDALVVLPDTDLQELYEKFIALYTGAHTPELLSWCGLTDGATLSEAGHGFVEMQLMRVGALLEVPQAARMARHENEKAQAAADKSRVEQRQAHQAREAELLRTLHEADAAAFAALSPHAVQWERGEGDEKAVRRYQRRKELQLLVMAPSQMKERLPTHEWSQLMTSGLEQAEVRALSHALRQPGVPPQAAPFVELLRQRVLSFGPADAAAVASGTPAARLTPPAIGNGALAPPPIVGAPSAPGPPPPAPPPPPPPAGLTPARPAAPQAVPSAAVGGRSVHMAELNAAVAKRKADAERDTVAVGTPRAAREEQLRRKRGDLLRGVGTMSNMYSRMSRRYTAGRQSRAAVATDGGDGDQDGAPGSAPGAAQDDLHYC